MSDWDAGFLLGAFLASVFFVVWFMVWTFDATHDVSTSLNQKVCMRVDDIGSQKCITAKDLLQILRDRK
jgi:hypothetical protein